MSSALTAVEEADDALRRVVVFFFVVFVAVAPLVCAGVSAALAGKAKLSTNIEAANLFNIECMKLSPKYDEVLSDENQVYFNCPIVAFTRVATSAGSGAYVSSLVIF